MTKDEAIEILKDCNDKELFMDSMSSEYFDDCEKRYLGALRFVKDKHGCFLTYEPGNGVGCDGHISDGGEMLNTCSFCKKITLLTGGCDEEMKILDV